MKNDKKDIGDNSLNPFEDEVFDDVNNDSPEQAFDIIDQDESFFASPEALDEMLDEFEKATDDMAAVKPEKISANDKKSANKKKLARTLFFAVAVIVVIASVLIILYAAKNNKNDEPSTNIPEPTAQEYVTDEPVITEPDTAEELTTVSTTNSTTEPITTTTTTTTQATTEATTVATTAAPTTTKEFTTAAPYTGRYVKHVVKYGDTFYSILREHGVKDTVANVDTMCALNGITSYYLQVGSTINVPIDL